MNGQMGCNWLEIGVGNWGLSPVLRRKIIAMEEKYDEQFRVVFEAIRQLLIEEEKPKKRIGF